LKFKTLKSRIFQIQIRIITSLIRLTTIITIVAIRVGKAIMISQGKVILNRKTRNSNLARKIINIRKGRVRVKAPIMRKVGSTIIQEVLAMSRNKVSIGVTIRKVGRKERVTSIRRRGIMALKRSKSMLRRRGLSRSSLRM